MEVNSASNCAISYPPHMHTADDEAHPTCVPFDLTQANRNKTKSYILPWATDARKHKNTMKSPPQRHAMAPENLGPTSNLEITSEQTNWGGGGGVLHCTCSDIKFVPAQLEGPLSHHSVGGSVGMADPFFLRQVQFERKLSCLCYCCTVNYRRRK
jgi:hypothetical protein